MAETVVFKNDSAVLRTTPKASFIMSASVASWERTFTSCSSVGSST